MLRSVLHHISLCHAKDNNIVADVERAGDISELVLDDLLEYITVRVGAEVESCVTPESFVCCECRNVPTLWG